MKITFFKVETIATIKSIECSAFLIQIKVRKNLTHNLSNSIYPKIVRDYSSVSHHQYKKNSSLTWSIQRRHEW